MNVRRCSLVCTGAALLFSGSVGLPGCSRGGPVVAPVRGTVTYDGVALDTGSVLFIPESGGKFASADIQPDGSYRLTTFRENDGAIVGSHRIMVSAVRFPNGIEAPAIPIIPFRYGSDRTSGLTAVVAETSENVVDLSLTSKPAAKR